MAEASSAERRSCIFCRIADGEEGKESDILYKDDDFVCFRDIRPVASHHYLIVPRQHLPSVKYLDRTYVATVERMVEVGMSLLQRQGGDMNDVRTGFHWPPFTTVKHLHLHVISPTSEMGFLARHVVYKPDWWVFATSDWTISYLKNKVST